MPVNSETLRTIRLIYKRRTVADRIEWLYKYGKERLLGSECCDYSVFDKTILYYQEVMGQSISYEDALSRALDKTRHKNAWHARRRNNN